VITMRHCNITRRTFLGATALGGVAAFAPPLLLADARTDARLIVVILRGALDGLAAVPPYADGHYARARGELAITSPQLKLDGMFGLHPSLEHLHARFIAKELLVFHAIASPYRERSHFDGQDLLENGTTRPHGRDGWLNRALRALPEQGPRDHLAVALAQNVPLVLRGEAPVNSWAPSRLPATDTDTLQRIADLYSADPYFASRLQAALATDSIAGDGMMAGAKRDPLGAFGTLTSSAGKLLAANDGPRIAVIEANGWDTHANQGAERGQLANRLRSLDIGLDNLRTSLGTAWGRTAVVVLTEFGRTVAVNGTRGTDHGTATCAFVVGGAVAGGRVIADWPGLDSASLYQSRDLRPTADLRSVCKGVLASHLLVSESALETAVFPDSRTAPPIEGLLRSRSKTA
jgi:uncharacterized protein (DUF1501 family)